MEHLHTKKDSWLTWSLFVCLILALSLSTAACGKKKKSSGIATTPPKAADPVTPGCTDCGEYSKVIDSGLNLTKGQGYFEMSLTVNAPSSAAIPYNGAVAVKGHLKVLKPYITQYGQIQVGEYKVYTKTANGSYGIHQGPFHLMNVQAYIKGTSSSSAPEIPLVIQGLDFKNYPDRTVTEGGKSYIYNGTFYGNVSFGGNPSFTFGIE